MLTPPRPLTLVHAVQQPLIEPQFQNLTSREVLGETFALLLDEYPISGKSTIKVDMHADWQEPIDDLSDAPQPVILSGSMTPFSTSIEPETTVARVLGRHEFHDTKHRKVNYTAIATTRFREYFPAAITANPDNLTRKSLPQTLSILNSARPAAPKILYVIPTFGWEPQTEDAWVLAGGPAVGCESISTVPGTLPAKGSCWERCSGDARHHNTKLFSRSQYQKCCAVM